MANTSPEPHWQLVLSTKGNSIILGPPAVGYILHLTTHTAIFAFSSSISKNVIKYIQYLSQYLFFFFT